MAYTQLIREQRYQIYTLINMGISQKEIAQEVGVSPSTISRELKRNQGKQGRYLKSAHSLALKRRQEKAKVRISRSEWDTIETFLRKDLSPEQCSNWLRIEQGIRVSHEWIYQYILKDKALGGSLFIHLRCKKKNRKRYGKVRQKSSAIRESISIHDRPKVVDTRERYGDWEVDTVIGRQSGKVLVTLVERKSRLSVIGLSANKSAEAVKETILRLLKRLSSCVHTLTYDNGPEFAQHQSIDRELGSQGYFADPFSSWQRGSSENTNGLIRQYLPKRSSFDKVSQERLEWIMKRLNNRPRKCLNWKAPNKVFFKNERIALTS